MKVRIVEFRFDLRPFGFGRSNRSSSIDSDFYEKLSEYDPGVTDGWVPVEKDGEGLHATARSRQFFDVESLVEESDPIPGSEEDPPLPGATLSIELRSGEQFTAHNAVVAESYGE